MRKHFFIKLSNISVLTRLIYDKDFKAGYTHFLAISDHTYPEPFLVQFIHMHTEQQETFLYYPDREEFLRLIGEDTVKDFD